MMLDSNNDEIMRFEIVYVKEGGKKSKQRVREPWLNMTSEYITDSSHFLWRFIKGD